MPGSRRFARIRVRQTRKLLALLAPDTEDSHNDKAHLYDNKGQLCDARGQLYDDNSHLYDSEAHL